MPSGRDAASHATPYFFLSYAHRPGLGPDDEHRRNLLVKRFRDDLAQAVRQLSRASGDVDASDGDSPVGDGWSDRVSLALARCGTFVALYSDEYFSSEHCGKEWGAFAERIVADRTRRGSRSEAIIPVLWQPVAEEALPACAREVELRRYDLGPTYGRYGLNYLLRHLPEHRSEYEAVVYELARRIAEIAEHEAPPSTERPAQYDAQADAFRRPGDPGTRIPSMRILIAALTTKNVPRGVDPEMYGSRPADWRPFVPDYDRPVAEVARSFAASMGFQGLVESFEQNAEISGAEPSAPTLLVIDAWAVQDPSLRRQLSDFDRWADSRPWIRPMVLWNRANPANRLRAADLESRLTAALEHCRDRYRAAAPRVLDGIETVRDFVSELPDVMREVERRYFAAFSHSRPESRSVQEPPPRPRFRGSGPSLGPRGIPTDTLAERRAGSDSSDPERPR